MEIQRILLLVLIICIIYSCESKRGRKKKKKTRIAGVAGRKGREGREKQECALFQDPDLWTVKNGEPSYIKLDPYDFTGDLDISFWILPDLTYHNGPLFNVGSEDNFKYYEWKTKAVKTQFLVVEITYEAIALLTKVLWQQHLYQMELFTTYPKPYNLIDGHWAYVSASRKNAVWTLSLNDSIVLTEAVINKTDINLFGRHAYLGGRPGYTDNVFRGIIKDLRINGELVKLKGREMSGNAAVKDCDSDEVKQFAKDLVTSADETNEIGNGYYEEGYYPYEDDNGGNRIDWDARLNRKHGKNSPADIFDSMDNNNDDDGYFGNVYGLPL